MSSTTARMPLIDAIKAIACLLIVAHHLSVYGPMSDAAYALISCLIDGMYQYGRMAVQAFLVIGGFLTARSLAPAGVPDIGNPLLAIRKRYFRLTLPYLAALTLAIAAAAFAREWMHNDAIPDVPNIPQLLAHALLMQDLLNQDALSAGVWYVAIDFQLFALTVGLLSLSARSGLQHAGPLFLAVLTAASLFFFNRHSFMDETALYFFGSYGLGALAYWVSGRRDGMFWLALLALLVAAALLLDFRLRIAIAGGVMLVLGLGRHTGLLESLPVPQPLMRLGRISYSVFLVHFPICLMVNAVFFHFFPKQPIANLVGLALAMGASIAAGSLFYRWIEARPLTHKMRLLIPAGFFASSYFAALGSAI